MYQNKRNTIDDDDSNQSNDEVSWCKQNLIKLIVIVCLTIIAIGCAGALTFVLIKEKERERTLQEKKNAWNTRLEQCAPIIKTVGPAILNIIKVAFSILLI